MPAKPANENAELLVDACGACGCPNFWLFENGSIECEHCRTPVLDRRWFDPNEAPPGAA